MINKLKNEKGSITVYDLVAMLFLLAIVTARYLLANRQLKTQVAALGRIQNVYGKAYSGSDNNGGGSSGDGGNNKFPGGIDAPIVDDASVEIPIYNSEAYEYFNKHKKDTENLEPYYIYQEGKYYIGGKGKKYKLMSDIKVSENSQKIYKNKFLKSINFNNHVIYPSDGYYYCGYQSWGSY